MRKLSGLGRGPLSELPKLGSYQSKRISSYDHTGGNNDYIRILAGETKVIADIRGLGCIKHIWFGGGADEEGYLRKVLLKMYWDGEKSPSVEGPLGDFFGVGHGMVSNYVSLPLTMITADSPERPAMNCWFSMPFGSSAKIELTNNCEVAVFIAYFYIDYELYPNVENVDDLGKFHAKWKTECPCQPVTFESNLPETKETNTTGEENYVILEAEGRGHYVGCNLSVHALSPGWWGEGDDMIFIDGEKWPPSLHGTGTEDYFCFSYEFPVGGWFGPYHGVSLPGSTQLRDWSTLMGKTNKWTVYRFHIEDPIVFQRSIKVTLEHGHANNRGDEYSSVAYWYQEEPHKEFLQTT